MKHYNTPTHSQYFNDFVGWTEDRSDVTKVCLSFNVCLANVHVFITFRKVGFNTFQHQDVSNINFLFEDIPFMCAQIY